MAQKEVSTCAFLCSPYRRFLDIRRLVSPL